MWLQAWANSKHLTPIIGSTNPFTLENCLFGAIRLTTNADVDKYKYSGYDI